MTDAYLQSQGFAPTESPTPASRRGFDSCWRYQHANAAQDGALLFAEHPFGIDGCRLSALPAPLDGHDVFATVALQDVAAFEVAVAAFYVAHGGVGQRAAVTVPHEFRPYRRQQ